MFTNDGDLFESPFVSTDPYADPFHATTAPHGLDHAPGEHEMVNTILNRKDAERLFLAPATRPAPRAARDPLFSVGQGLGKATGNFLNSLVSGLGNKGQGARMYSDATGDASGGGFPQSMGPVPIAGPMAGGLSTLARAGLEGGFGHGGSGFGFDS